MLDIQAVVEIMQTNIIPISTSLVIGMIVSWLLFRPKISKRDEYITELEKSTKKNVAPAKPFDPYKIIKYPLSTEKSIRQIEFDNKLVFIVAPKSTKADVKRAVKELFKVNVEKVNVQHSFKGRKKAYIRLSPDSLASDVSADLGLI